MIELDDASNSKPEPLMSNELTVLDRWNTMAMLNIYTALIKLPLEIRLKSVLQCLYAAISVV